MKSEKIRHSHPTSPSCWRSKTTRIFCENSTIRGVVKLTKHRSLALRLLWIVFLILMTAGIIFSASSLTAEYLMYNTLINTREIETVADFPSVTFCSHHPFSKAAHRLWKSGEVTSPTDFNKQIRRAMQVSLDADRVEQAKTFFSSDKKTTYFETIGQRAAYRIGHNKSSMRFCVLQMPNALWVGHEPEECGIQSTIFLHPVYLNCQIIRVNPTFSKSVKTLGLIVEATSEVFHDYEMGLINDAFSHAHGTRVTLHEPGSYPDPVKYGFNLEAGKLTEMKFESVRWIRAGPPKEQCVESQPDQPVKVFRRQGQNFTYNYETCHQDVVARRLFDKCHCHSSFYPLNDDDINVKSGRHRFCNYIDLNDIDGTYQRLKCYQAFTTEEISGQQGQKSDGQCKHRCAYYTYNMHYSISRWLPADWQLTWLMHLNDAWTRLSISAKHSRAYNISLATIRQFIKHNNLSEIHSTVLGADQGVFFVVTRESFDTTEKVETLSLTINALFSQLGGLSSLTIGVTFATLFELIEFLYLFCRNRKRRRSTRKSAEPDRTEMTDLNSNR